MSTLLGHTEEDLLYKIEELYKKLGQICHGGENSTGYLTHKARKGRLILVFRELPLVSDGNRLTLSSDSPFKTTSILNLSEVTKTRDVHWVGISKVKQKSTFTEMSETRTAFDKAGNLQEYTAVKIEEKMFELYYNGYCTTCLWPLFHSSEPTSEYLLDAHETEEFVDRSESRMYNSFVGVNQRFADVVRDVYREGDLIFIHGFNLLLLPSLLRQLLPEAPIGFFLHIPFPSTEFYRIHSYREELLRGVLGANLIGFQTFGYARHFLAACTRILGLESSPRGVDYNGHFARITIAPVGIDPKEFESMCENTIVQSGIIELRNEFRGKVVLLGVDAVRMHAGLINKLVAFEELLRIQPDWRDKIVLIQVLLISAHCEDNLLSILHQIVGRVNGKYSHFSAKPYGPIYLITRRVQGVDEDSDSRESDYDVQKKSDSALMQNKILTEDLLDAGNDDETDYYSSSSLNKRKLTKKLMNADTDHELCSLLGLADVFVDTSTRSGMNIRPFQYTVCRSTLNATATLVLSEFSGVAHSLGGGALLVNPWDSHGTALTLAQAIMLPQKERKFYHNHIVRYVNEFTASRWMEQLVNRLESAHSEINQQVYLRKLEPCEVISAFNHTQKRLLVFDYENVLLEAQSLSELAAPTPDILRLVESLTDDPSNIVVLVTHRTKSFADKWFGHIHKIILSAESGAFIKWFDEDWTFVYLDQQRYQSLVVEQYPENRMKNAEFTSSTAFEDKSIQSTTVSSGFRKNFHRSASSNLSSKYSDCFTRLNKLLPTNRSFESSNGVLFDEQSGADGVATISNWRNQILPLFEYYRERTPGSTVEVAETNIAWYAHDADEEHGAWQANNLLVSLGEFCTRLPILTTVETKTVRVKIPMVSKANMMLHVLRNLQRLNIIPDMVCVMVGGEDRTDDDMFQLLMRQNEHNEYLVRRTNTKASAGKKVNQVILSKLEESIGENAAEEHSDRLKSTPLPFPMPWHFYTCIVGVKLTAAKEYVTNVQEAVSLLEAVINRNWK